MRTALACDGLYGHTNIRRVLSHMVEEAGGPVDLIVSLRQPPPDDYSDEQEALSLLSTDDRILTMEDGDLIWTIDP